MPIYPSLAGQNARKWWIFDRIYPLYRPNTGTPCLQFTLPYADRTQYIDFALRIFKLNADGTQDTSFLSYDIGLVCWGGFIKDFQNLGYSVIIWCGGYSVPGPLTIGRYYFEIRGQKAGEADYNYSLGFTDVITVVDDLSPYLKLEWWDEDDFVMDAGTIVYDGNGQIGSTLETTSFKNEVYLKTDLAKPDYIFEEEGETRDGYFFPFKQISEKRYRFKFFACEYLLDVLRFVRMSDHIRITYHGQVYNVDSLLMTPEWEEEGDVASVEVEFDTATVAKKVGNGYLRAQRGDFNDDFNSDFNNL